MGLGMGLVHALDVDHVVAVTTLSVGGRPGIRESTGFCLKWSLGHGITLLVVGFVVLVVGMAVPAVLSQWAENLVGGVLLLIGLWELNG